MAKDLISDIIDDLNKYGSNISKYSAIAVREELHKTARQAIDYFYDTYTPGDYFRRKADFAYENNLAFGGEANHTYQRTYNLYKSFKKYYKDNHGTTFSGGVILSPDYMADIYRGSRELVFDLAYSGFHGLNSWDQQEYRPATPYGVTTPSPMKMIMDKHDEIQKHPTSYINIGIKEANKQTYQLLY